jgi:hypothetical protein
MIASLYFRTGTKSPGELQVKCNMDSLSTQQPQALRVDSQKPGVPPGPVMIILTSYPTFLALTRSKRTDAELLILHADGGISNIREVIILPKCLSNSTHDGHKEGPTVARTYSVELVEATIKPPSHLVPC